LAAASLSDKAWVMGADAEVLPFLYFQTDVIRVISITHTYNFLSFPKALDPWIS
jgi:hypothetical protein